MRVPALLAFQVCQPHQRLPRQMKNFTTFGYTSYQSFKACKEMVAETTHPCTFILQIRKDRRHLRLGQKFALYLITFHSRISFQPRQSFMALIITPMIQSINTKQTMEPSRKGTVLGRYPRQVSTSGGREFDSGWTNTQYL